MVDGNVPSGGNEDKIAAMVERAAANIGATRLPEIAGVLPAKRDAFCRGVADIALTAGLAINARIHFAAGTFERVERAANELNNAVLVLTTEQFDFLQWRINSIILQAHRSSELANLWEYYCPPIRLAVALPLLAVACSDIVGKNPFRKGQEGNVRDWQFQCFIWDLWECAREHGGKLNATKRDKKYYGAMFKAVGILRDLCGGAESHLFRPGQEQSIVKVVTDAKEGRPPGVPKPTPID
jgi:hypothetical protein